MPYKFPEDKQAFDKAWRDKNREHKRAIDRDYNKQRRVRMKLQNAGKIGVHDSDRHTKQ